MEEKIYITDINQNRMDDEGKINPRIEASEEQEAIRDDVSSTCEFSGSGLPDAESVGDERRKCLHRKQNQGDVGDQKKMVAK